MAPVAYMVSHYKLNTSIWCLQSSLGSIRDSKKGINRDTNGISCCASQGLQARAYSNLTLYDNYAGITSEVLNNLLIKQQVSITQVELERLKKIRGIKYSLPLDDQNYSSFINLVGTPKTRGLKAGVYIFTHLATGSQYVGSSNSLSRRLDQYFTFKQFNVENSGLLLPLIKKEGFDKFSLEIFVMPVEFSSGYYFLFLEQYHLLNKRFNLNTQRIVNFRVSQGTNIYLYDIEGKILFYASKSLNQIRDDLGIHYATCTNCIRKGESYLNFFRITDTPIDGAIKANWDNSELANLIFEKRKLFLSNTLKEKVSSPITIKDVETGESFELPSIVAAVRYLKSKNIKADRNILTKYLNKDKPYKGYLYYRTGKS